MRVTKTIKDHVVKIVRKIYSEPTEEEKTYLALKEAINAEVDRLNEKFKPMIEEEIKTFNHRLNEKFKPMIKEEAEAFNKIYGLDERTGAIGVNDDYVCTYNSYNLLYTAEIGKKARKAEKARAIKIDEAIENIIVTLELGGNKADLDRMLNELKENK